ncbi:MAG: alpha-ketoglutarate-dependent dioxygenase AlkB [Actinobacteria bacterium]|nr:alpha-ketoglutarate-dependent dioxygenase AlkB [Actinomycetota bacterium]
MVLLDDRPGSRRQVAPGGSWQGCLDLELADSSEFRRVELSEGAWVDHCPGWAGPSLMEPLTTGVQWRAERREMYDRFLDVPRLVARFDDLASIRIGGVAALAGRLNDHYGFGPGHRNRLSTCGLCLYRDGRDSVAWHGDRMYRTDDTIVAIVSFGSARTLRLRPNEGGRSLSFQLGDGDLLVMGGSCQETWQHQIPKTSQWCGPRISLQFRPGDVA